MAKRTSKDVPEAGSWADRLAKLVGQDMGIDLEELDSHMLWMATIAVASESGSLTLGLTRDRAQWVSQVWDGKYSDKRYHASTADLNRMLAAIVRLKYGNKVHPDVEKMLQGYGW